MTFLHSSRTLRLCRRLAGLAVAWLVLAGTGAAMAQAPFDAARIPKKDIVIFVDVSGSIHPSASAEAGRIVEDIVTGRLSPARYPDWDWSGARADKYTHFQGFLDGSANGAGLTEPGRAVFIERIGDLSRVRELGNRYLIRQFPADLDRIFSLYPSRPSDFTDQNTYYELAMAKAREMMRQSGDDGFYLFVISDGVDTNAEKYGADETRYIGSLRVREEEHFIADIHYTRLAATSEIQSGAKTPVRKVAYTPMKDFFIRWYAVGRKEPNAIDRPVAAPEPPPDLPRALQLLGGLEGREPGNAKVYHSSQPFLAWQIANYTGDDPVDFTVDVMLWKDGQAVVPVPAAKLRDGSEFTRVDLGHELAENAYNGYQLRDLEDGVYQVTIKPSRQSKATLREGEDKRLEVTTYIRVDRPFSLWPWIAGFGTLCGLGLFYHMWRTLRTQGLAPRRA